MLGGVGIAAMNGPAVMFCALVAIAVSTVSAVGNTPIPRIPDHRRPLRNRCGLAPGTTARTSYGGLELLHRYVRRLGLYPRLRRACADLGGGYGGARVGLFVLPLVFAGGRRGGGPEESLRRPPRPPVHRAGRGAPPPPAPESARPLFPPA